MFRVTMCGLSRIPLSRLGAGLGRLENEMIAIRPLLIGIILILALVLIALSILLVDRAQPLRQSESLIPIHTEPGQQRP